jgi:hypothetical protein
LFYFVLFCFVLTDFEHQHEHDYEPENDKEGEHEDIVKNSPVSLLSLWEKFRDLSKHG